jgi:hypothetical protein
VHEKELEEWEEFQQGVKDGTKSAFTAEHVGNVGRNNASNDFNGNGSHEIVPGITLRRNADGSFSFNVTSNAPQGSVDVTVRATGDVMRFAIVGEGNHSFTFVNANGIPVSQSDMNGFGVSAYTRNPNQRPVFGLYPPDAPNTPEPTEPNRTRYPNTSDTSDTSSTTCCTSGRST